MNREVVGWLRTHFLPFEAELRRMLQRVCTGKAEVDDVIQETYCKVLAMGAVDHVVEPRAFLARTAKNIVNDRLRRDAIVNIDAMANLEEIEIADGAPSPERVVMARAELRWIVGLIADLPDRCRKVFRARRINGLSQKETADEMGISVGIVEYETTRAMDLISDMISRAGMHDSMPPSKEQRTKRAKKHDVNH
jgi:RNA polymerase sigma-70 factor (ECF subfamily)